MPLRLPLVIDTGVVQQLQAGDEITPNPISKTFAYSGTQLTSITTVHGVKTFNYTGTQLTSIVDTASGRTSTFNYTGSVLDNIVVTTT